MSVLSHQSAINPTQNFWGTGSGSGIAPFYVGMTGDTFDASLTDGNFFGCGDPINFPTLPYDVVYFVSCYFNLSSGGVDSGEFELQLSGTSTSATTPCNFSASKGWFSMSLSTNFTIPATIDGETIAQLIFNNSGDTIPVVGNCRMYAVGFPMSPP